MAAAAPKRLIVLGGTGFLGSFICKHAVRRGCPVVSVSRRGERPAVGAEWNQHVDYVSFDMLREDPKELFDQMGLERVDSSTYNRFEGGPSRTAVISTAGQLIDSTWPRPIQALYTSLKKQSMPSSLDSVQSYEEVNRDLHIRAALAASETSGVDAFVYISSALPNLVQANIPFLGRYHSTRRDTEMFLAELETAEFRPVALRPTIIYDGQDSAHFQSMPLATVSAFSNLTDKLVFNRLNLSVPHLLPTPPVSADFVAECAVEAALNCGVSGALNIEEMTRLTNSIVLQ